MKVSIQDQIRAAIPTSWTDRLIEGAPTTMGYDVATTTKVLSNPGSFAVMQQKGREYVVPLLLRWKASEDLISNAVVDCVLGDLAAARCNPQALGIDATSEKYFATQLRRRLAGQVPVILCVFSENTEVAGEKMTMKAAGCGAYVGDFEDNVIGLPNQDFVYADHRLVKDFKGTYLFEEDSQGNHADTFAAAMLARYVMGKNLGLISIDVATGERRRGALDDDDDDGPVNLLQF